MRRTLSGSSSQAAAVRARIGGHRLGRAIRYLERRPSAWRSRRSSGSSLENELSNVDLGPGFENAKITDVNLHVRIDHTADPDLDIWLIHDGVTVQVSRDNGDDGDDYGTGADCTNPTTVPLDDSATTAISSGTSPFAGSFQPDSPLEAFDGKSRKATGRSRSWTTPTTPKTGTLVCWKLEITVAVADLEVTVTDTPDPTAVGNELTYSATVKNLGPDEAVATKLAVKLPTGAEFVSATPDTCGDVAGDELMCDLGDLANGASSVIDLVVRPTRRARPAPSSAPRARRRTPRLEQQPGSGRHRRPGRRQRRHRDDHGRDARRGRGTVTSDPAGIDCGSDCEGGFLEGTTVTLTATPANPTRGSLPGAAPVRAPRADQPCEVIADGDTNVTVTFDKKSGGGNGGGVGRRSAASTTCARSPGRRQGHPQGHAGHGRHLRPRRQRQALRPRRRRPDLRRHRQATRCTAEGQRQAVTTDKSPTSSYGGKGKDKAAATPRHASGVEGASRR